MIKASAQVTNPDEARLSITIEMSIGDWRRQLEQLPAAGYPSWRVAAMIDKAIRATIGHVESVKEQSE